MKTKVTISLEEEFVKKAKRFAKSNKRTLSAQINASVTKDWQSVSSAKRKMKIIAELAGSVVFTEEDSHKPYKQLRNEAYSTREV